MPEEFRTLAELLRSRARSQPAATAQIFGERITTYAVFDRHASQVANGLIALGVEPQARVGYLGKNSDLFFELLFGCLKANTVFVPVNWRLASAEAAKILADSGATVLFVGPGFAPMAAEIARSGITLHLVSLDGATQDWPDFAGWRDVQPPDDPAVPDRPEDTVVQIYTSGTTGTPKGVEISNRNEISGILAAQDAGWAVLGPQDVALTCMPIFHISGMNIGLLALANGGTNIVMQELTVPGLLDLIPRHGVTWVFLVPAVILALVNHSDVAAVDFRSLRRLVYGASPIAEDLLLRARKLLPETEFWQVYGLTEATGMGTVLPPWAHEPGRGKLRSCGLPYPGLELRIAGATGETLPSGEVGEIIIRHPCVMKGYWKNSQASEAAFFAGGWLRTGDAAYADREGFIYIHDRIKDMIITGGENVYPAEVENALFDHPEIADCAVIGVPDERWGEAVKAIVVLKANHSATAAEIIAHARARIAGYKLPKSVDFRDSLPRTPTGKVLRRELRAPYWAGRHRQVS